MARTLITVALLVLVALLGMSQLISWALNPPANLAPLQTAPVEAPLISTRPTKQLTPQQLQRQGYEGIVYINLLRRNVGLNRLTIDNKLSKAAGHHSRYSVINDFQGHEEASGKLHFTGQTPNQRAFFVDFKTHVNEVISYNRQHPEQYVDDLMSAIYHRLSLLRMDIDLIGTGVAQDNQGLVKSTFTALTSNRKVAELCETQRAGKPGELFYKGQCKTDIKVPMKPYHQAHSKIAMHNPKLVVWPQNDSIVSPVFYEENPDPLPQCNVSGYPPHIQVNPIYQGRIQFLANSFKLFELVDGERVPVKAVKKMNNLNNPHQPQTNRSRQKHAWYAFFPEIRLNWGGHYQAEVQYRENGRIFTKRWNFKTEKLPGLVVFTSAQGNRTPLPIKLGEIKTVYFQPNSCFAPRNSEVNIGKADHVKLEKTFLDGQTLQVRINQARRGDLVKLYYGPTQTIASFKE